VPWVAHEWLSELVFFVLYRFGGWPALLLWQAILGVGIFVLMDLLLRRRGVRPAVRVFCLLVALSGTPLLWFVRPHLWTALFLMVLLLLLDLQRTRPGHRSLWLIPFLFVLWANLHSGFSMGLMVLGLWWVVGLWGMARTSMGGHGGPPLRWEIQTLFPLSVVACLLNPHGWQLLLLPFTFINGSLPNYKYIAEWAAPALRIVPVFYTVLIGVILLSWVRTAPTLPSPASPLAPLLKERGARGVVVFPSPGDIGGRFDRVLFLLFLVLGFSAVRHTPLFVLAAMPLFSSLLHDWIRQWPTSLQARVASWESIESQLDGVLLAALIVVAGSVLLLDKRLPIRVEDKLFPIQAVQAMKANHWAGRYLHHYNWGGYLIWNCWPQWQVFIDGRNEVHGLKFMEDDYLEAVNAGPQWREVLTRWKIDHVLLPPDAPLVQVLKEQPGWTVVYADAEAVILAETK
jgi:hypothetical protein